MTNRKLKFRGWNVIDKKMVNVQWNASFDEDGSINISPFVILMQFIGLQDKNKKDIYEGDIGEVINVDGIKTRFEIKWGIHRRDMTSGWTVDIPSFCFEIEDFPTYPIVNNYKGIHDLDMVEIIGNIYENPELLMK